MNESEKLKVYLEKIRVIAESKVEDGKTPAIVALKEAIHYIEGEMVGY